MKKIVLIAIAFMLVIGTWTYGQCAADPAYGNIILCPRYPYIFSEVTSPSFQWVNPPLNTIGHFWLQIAFQNNGIATAYNVSAKISCFPAGSSSGGDISVSFPGPIAPGNWVKSSDDFQIIMDAGIALPEAGWCWEITYKDANGKTYVVTDVAKFCGEDCCIICDCTVIELESFTVVPANNKVTLTWKTAAERNNVGFNIYRAESKDGKYVKINSDIIPAQGSSVQGVKYTYADNTAKNRTTYYYKLEDIDTSGNLTLNGPYSATPRLIFGLFNR